MKILKVLFCCWTILMISNFPVLFLFFKNAGDVGFSEIVRLVIIYSGIGIFLFLFSLFFIKEVYKATLISALLIVVLSNFRTVENFFEMIFRSMRYWHVLTVIILLLFLISKLIIKNIPKDLNEIFVKVFGLVATVLVLINAVIAIPNIKKYAQIHKTVIAYEDKNFVDHSMPNVYLLIFDEYASFEQIEEFYGYDNKDLKKFLKENNFNISSDSHNEYFATHICVTNLLNLNYVVSPFDDELDVEVIRKNGKWFSVMEELGYNVQAVEVGDFLGHYSPTRKQGNINAATINGETLEDLCVKQTVLYPFYLGNINSSTSEIFEVCDYMSLPQNIPQNPTFTVFYVCFPHQPFVVDENGNKLPTSAYNDWENDEYYLGQYKYATKLMINILNNLVTNDPDSVIFLQSDHGARAAGTDLHGNKFPADSMTGILNVVYLKGEKLDCIDGMSAVNTVRIVLSKLYGFDYEQIEVPNYFTPEN